MRLAGSKVSMSHEEDTIAHAPKRLKTKTKPNHSSPLGRDPTHWAKGSKGGDEEVDGTP